MIPAEKNPGIVTELQEAFQSAESGYLVTSILPTLWPALMSW